jgi:hypothetical protein
MEGYQYITDNNGRPVPELEDESTIGISPRVIKRLFALIYDKVSVSVYFKSSFLFLYRSRKTQVLNTS